MNPAVIAWWLAAAALTFGVILWVMRPLVDPAAAEDALDAVAVGLIAEREAALASIRDLDADFRDGRIDTATHDELRTRAVARAARALAALQARASSAEEAEA